MSSHRRSFPELFSPLPCSPRPSSPRMPCPSLCFRPRSSRDGGSGKISSDTNKKKLIIFTSRIHHCVVYIHHDKAIPNNTNKSCCISSSCSTIFNRWERRIHWDVWRNWRACEDWDRYGRFEESCIKTAMFKLRKCRILECCSTLCRTCKLYENCTTMQTTAGKRRISCFSGFAKKIYQYFIINVR